MSRRTPTRLGPVVATTAALILTPALAGCGGEAPEADDPAPTASATAPEPTETAKGKPTRSPEAQVRTVQVRIAGGTVEPEATSVELDVGEPLRLDITSDRSGELHVHSSPESTPGFPSGRSSVTLRFDKPGQVDVEEHESGVLILRALVR